MNDDNDDEGYKPTISSRLAEALIDTIQLEYGNELLSRADAMTIAFSIMNATFQHVRPGDDDDVEFLINGVRAAIS